jgi:ubiquitin-like 1-activating enzyme E1 B
MHFISAAANLRMYCFSIEQLNFNQIKNMAGNIIPAIASTNSIVSAVQLTEMLKLLSGQ